MHPLPREERLSPGNRGSRPVGSAWVACSLRQSDIYQLVEEFAIPPEFVVSLPPPDSHPSSPLPGYMSFFVSQLRAGLRFPIPSFFREVSRDLKLKLTEPGVFHFAPRRGVSFLPTPSPPKHWKETDGAPGCTADVMKGALPTGDKRLLSSLSSEDLDHMLTLVLTRIRLFFSIYIEGREFILSIRRVGPVPGRGFCKELGGEGATLAGGSG
ncbi:UNVERIFIED_CONTAM: hypothetical protein Slati_2215300 [Sesamum latifolium]|uniref:Uncharacterized protein n=1 Tax=Sesamum latifolium TaxID=2727402 RepID=A0AAW2WYA4_9LAMI